MDAACLSRVKDKGQAMTETRLLVILLVIIVFLAACVLARWLEGKAEG